MSEQPLSPQGYNIGSNPKNFNPFWEQAQGSGIGDVTAGANTLATGEQATASVESVDNPGTGKTDLRFSFGIPEGRPGAPGAPGEAGAPGRGIGVVAAETNTGSGVGVRVRETENVQNNEVDLTFQFDFPSGSQSLEFTLLGTYLEEEQPPDDLVSRIREYPVVGFGVATRSVNDDVPSHDIQALIPTVELPTMPDIHLCKASPAKYRCTAFLRVTVRPKSNGSKIIYYSNVKYMAPLIPITINGKTYYVNATSDGDPSAPKYYGLCVWGVRLKEGSVHE